MKKRTVSAVCYLPTEDIRPGPMQPRRSFSRPELEELRDSIMEHGVIQPLTVRAHGGAYELIAGERRLRAARMAGLWEVPCIIMDVDLEDSGVIALIENIQRRDLDFVEEAEGISKLINLFGLSQEEAARRLGKSQSAVANKLRILRLDPEILQLLRDSGMTERHARALLRLEDSTRQALAAEEMAAAKMNVAAAEEYVERLLRREEKPPKAKRRRSLLVMKDVRLFVNSLNHSLEVMRRGGIDADLSRLDSEDEVVLTVRISKTKER